MADIVLRDGSGNYQTYSGAKALGVDTVDGGIAVFVSEDAVPSNYKHPATHPASMISGLVVGDIPQLATAERDFTLDKELGCYAYEVPGAWEHALGDTYKVHWNGTDYTLVVKDFADVLAGVSNVHYMGNATKFLGLGMGEDTREPFVVALSTIDCTCVIMTDTVGPHTVGIEAPNTIKKLNAKYLPDGIATEKWVEQKISEIEVSGGSSSGGGSAEVDILPEQEAIMPLFVDSLYGIADITGETELFSHLSKMKMGETYHVILDGVEYILSDMLDSLVGELPPGKTVRTACALGNPAFIDLGDDNGLPIAIEVLDITEPQDDGTTLSTKQAVIIVKSDSNGEESITCTLRIYQPGTTKLLPDDFWINVENTEQKINIAYIPDPPFFDLTAIGLPDIPLSGDEIYIECDTSEILTAAAKGLVKISVSVSGHKIENISGMVYIPDLEMYEMSFMAVMFATPYLMNIGVYPDAISAKVYQLTTTT